ncbi:MAG: aspartate-semialdehyde dehydrogenase family protein [Oscillospiraceae bacterium]|jgi:aspartate-semialdehyde dehydrogenase|nr:aspartate-semialdehyde dehydrogenase family protein [Oscillospiraceae bacterium]
MSKRYRVGIIGATGMVGQRFALLLAGHPWFEVTALAASERSAGKAYGDLMATRWLLAEPCPEKLKAMLVLDAEADRDTVVGLVDFVFCAVDMPKGETRALEESYARAECPVVSSNSATRGLADVPMIVPELNAAHAEVIPAQRKRLGTKRGFVTVKSNCSLQSYVPALFPLPNVEDVLVCTYQAISGAGKSFETWPEMVDNVIPFIGGEEEKSEQEPLKIFGRVVRGEIQNAALPRFTAQCLRVPVSDGHMAAVFFRFAEGKKLSKAEILALWDGFAGEARKRGLPSAPQKFLRYFAEDDMPQTKLHRSLDGGMTVSIGRLREDTQYDYKFVCLSHNTLLGAAGGSVLTAELLCAQGWMD